MIVQRVLVMQVDKGRESSFFPLNYICGYNRKINFQVHSPSWGCETEATNSSKVQAGTNYFEFCYVH